MATVESPVLSKADSIFDLGDRLAGLLQQIRDHTVHDEIPESSLSRLADAVEALRSRLVRKAEHDPRSLFDLDQRLIELMDCAEEAAEQGEISQDLLDEINEATFAVKNTELRDRAARLRLELDAADRLRPGVAAVLSWLG